jgi:hypothetical protein
LLTIHTADPARVLSAVNALSMHDRIVHATIAGLLAAILLGFTVFSRRLGLDRVAPLFALILFAIGTIALFGAALLDGSVVPDLARKYGGGDPATLRLGVALLTYSAIVLQELTRFAIVLSCAAIALWSIALMAQQRQIGARVVGMLGIVAAAYACVALSLTGYLSPHSLVGIAAAQNSWYLLAGVLLLRGDLASG